MSTSPVAYVVIPDEGAYSSGTVQDSHLLLSWRLPLGAAANRV